MTERTDSPPPTLAEEGMGSAATAAPAIEVRGSGIHGLGVFATASLPAHAFLGRYQGRRYAADEVGRREWDRSLTYVFGLSDGSLIDAAEGGNATRHINHACEPNCIAYEVEDEDGSLHIEIETLRELQPGEELLLDYALDVADESPDAYACHCGSPRCRGTLVGRPA